MVIFGPHKGLRYDPDGECMSDPGHETKQEAGNMIGIDIACPECEYNLRGLPGPIVDCPECGLTTDVPVLAARQWNKPWYKAPGFNTLIWPAGWALIGWYLIAIASDMTRGNPWVCNVAMMTVMAVWIWLMILAGRRLNGTLGFSMALLSHVLLLGFLVSIWGLIAILVYGILGLIQRDLQIIDILHGVAWFVGFSVLLWICRRIERAIAGVCIRHHLRRKTTQ